MRSFQFSKSEQEHIRHWLVATGKVSALECVILFGNFFVWKVGAEFDEPANGSMGL